jgi:uncharacterized protein
MDVGKIPTKEGRMSPTVVLMLKAPVPGRVKTRLAAGVGADPACAIYRELVEHQMGHIPKDWRVEVHFDPPDAAPAMISWLGKDRLYYPQCPGDLGVRLIHSLVMASPSERFPLIFLGGDCPYIDKSVLMEAVKALEAHDVVVGPARDGGYVLIGMKAPHPDMFREIDWSTDRVLTQTLERAKNLGLLLTQLPVLEDVDDLASWERARDYLNRS